MAAGTDIIVCAVLSSLIIVLSLQDSDVLRVRLDPGPDEGRLEIQMLTLEWGTVCDHDMRNNVATVVCRVLQLPVHNSYWVQGPKFGRGSLPPLLSQVVCIGNETSLANCNVKRYSDSAVVCPLSTIVGIVCTGEPLPAVLFYDAVSFSIPGQTLKIFEDYIMHCQPTNSSLIKGFYCFNRGMQMYTGSFCPRRNTVTRVQKGNFSCEISNVFYQNQDTLQIYLDVMYPPLPLIQTHVRAIEGRSVKISLTNIPNPLPYLTQWRRTGSTMRWNQTEIFRMYNPITRADAGEFLVYINNTMISSTDKVKEGYGKELLFIDVLYKPSIVCNDILDFTPGTNVTITCQVDGNPLPHHYIWTDSSGSIITQGPEAKLDVEKPGTYKCTAVNKMEDDFGNEESSVDVDEATVATDKECTECAEDDASTVQVSNTTIALITVVVLAVAAVVGLTIVIFRQRAGSTGNANDSHGKNGEDNSAYSSGSSMYMTPIETPMDLLDANYAR